MNAEHNNDQLVPTFVVQNLKRSQFVPITSREISPAPPKSRLIFKAQRRRKKVKSKKTLSLLTSSPKSKTQIASVMRSAKWKGIREQKGFHDHLKIVVTSFHDMLPSLTSSHRDDTQFLIKDRVASNNYERAEKKGEDNLNCH
jgi:hypothetical protein